MVQPQMREDLDRISGASNGPDIVGYLRRDTGLEIPCERVHGTDRDGRPCAPGRYSLTPKDREKALRLQRAAHVAPKQRPGTYPSPARQASEPKSKQGGRK